MSDLFIVSDEVVNPKNRNRPFKLNNDLLKGFKDSAENGQVRLALEYLIHIFDILTDQLDKDQNESKKTVKIASEAEVTTAEKEANTKRNKKQEELTLDV